MKFEIKQILQPLDLGEYNEPYRGLCVQVWVNPPRDFTAEHQKLLNEYATRWLAAREDVDLAKPAGRPTKKKEPARTVKALLDFDDWVVSGFTPSIHGWFARLFSQGPEETCWTAEELDEMAGKDPALLAWLKRRAIEMIEEHLEGKKKS